MRAGEFTVKSSQDYAPDSALSLQDVAIDSHDNPSMVRARLTPSGMGWTYIYIGHTDTPLCPEMAVSAYCALCPPTPGLFFIFQDGSPLTRDRLVSAVRLALVQSGVEVSHYSVHSFRIGAATTPAQQNISDATIKMLGCWESSAHEHYVRTLRESLAAITRRLAN